MKARRVLILIAALALGAAACGDGEQSPAIDDAPNTAPDTTVADAAPEATEAPEPDEDPVPSQAPTTTEPGDGVRGVPVNPDAVLAAFSQTEEQQSGRMKGSFSMTGIEAAEGVGDVEIPFSGAFSANGDFAFSMDLTAAGSLGGQEVPPEMAALLGEMEIRQIGDTAYMRFDFLSIFLGLPTEWLAGPADEAGLEDGFGFATPTSPADLLGTFADADAAIEDLGPEVVNDLPTTHYRVIFDTESLYEQASAAEQAEFEAQGIPSFDFPMDVWITDDGIVARFVMEMDGSSLTAPDGQGFGQMAVTYDLYDLGTDVVIDPPPADQVTTEEELEALLGENFATGLVG